MTLIGTHVGANGTTSFATQPTYLSHVTINTRGANGNTVTIYDGTAAQNVVLAVIDTTVSLGTLLYDVNLTNGLTVVMANGNAADVTVAWAAA